MIKRTFGILGIVAVSLFGITLVPIKQLTPAAKTGTYLAESVNGVTQWVLFPIFTQVPTWVTEFPTGLINGTNAVFTLSFTPIPNSQTVYLNGIALFSGTGDYLISGNTITFQAGQIPQASPTPDTLVVTYQH